MDDKLILFASDLDNTLIHSYKTAQPDHICVECKDAKPLSFMTPKSHMLLKQAIELVSFVPVTTRSVEQYNRICFFEDYYPEYALVSNGGNLLVNNEIDEQWYEESKNMMREALDELKICAAALANDENRSFEIRMVDGLYLFTKSKNAEKTMELLHKCTNLRHVVILNLFEKIYVMPSCLNKGTAVKRIKEKLKAKKIICAGDSLFDVPMLKMADIAIAPRRILQNDLDEKHFLLDDHIYFGESVLESVIKSVSLLANGDSTGNRL